MSARRLYATGSWVTPFSVLEILTSSVHPKFVYSDCRPSKDSFDFYSYKPMEWNELTEAIILYEDRSKDIIKVLSLHRLEEAASGLPGNRGSASQQCTQSHQHIRRCLPEIN